MARERQAWRCTQCGRVEPKWAGRCSDCGEFGTFVEEAPSGRRPRGASGARAVSLSEVDARSAVRAATGIGELDRVLGGGLVRGSLVLIGGEPGVGKSTLLLEAADSLARAGSDVLYVCGEESPSQVKLRAERLGATSDFRLLASSDVDAIEEVALDGPCSVLIVDSIQSVRDEGTAGGAGSVTQVRETTARLMRLSKEHGVTTIIVGHVTKDGTLAGPRMLEHMVDTVLYFEGDRDHAFRVVRAAKNRFGSVSEIGVFEMGETGLTGVADPSAALLASRPAGVAGSAVMAAVEGSRALMLEIQALVTPSFTPMPRRLATGIDPQRLLQVLAVLERRAGLAFGSHDVYVSVAGGVRVTEPAVDLPLALALSSALSDRPVPAEWSSFGEIGLAGEVRPVGGARSRLAEAVNAGLSRVVAPPGAARDVPEGVTVIEVATVAEAVALARG